MQVKGDGLLPEKEEPELMYKIYDFISDSMFRINDEINRV